MHASHGFGQSIKRSIHCSKDTSPSIIHKVVFKNRIVHIKRDDQLNYYGVNGNKSRKLKFFDRIALPKQIISYGGAQSNAMLAISMLAKHFNIDFYYITKHIPQHLKANPYGSLKISIDNGMKIIDGNLELYNEIALKKDHSLEVLKLIQNSNILPNVDIQDALFVPQGVACELAYDGSKLLMNEIIDYIGNYTENDYPWKVIFASGTGTTAFYSNLYLNNQQFENPIPRNIEVVAVPCLGSDRDILNRMIELQLPESIVNKALPCILSTSDVGNKIFAKPCPEHIALWRQLSKETEIDSFDLVYAPRCFEILISRSYESGGDIISLFEAERVNLLYYHCGGAEGNASQLQRYKRLNIL